VQSLNGELVTLRAELERLDYVVVQHCDHICVRPGLYEWWIDREHCRRNRSGVGGSHLHRDPKAFEVGPSQRPNERCS
jgi:hypothetical protein